MDRIAVLYSGVNTRADADINARILRTTSALTLINTFGVTKVADGDGFYWLHVRYDDELEAFVRADKARIVGDFRPVGMPLFDTLGWAQTRMVDTYGRATTPAVQPPATAPTSPATTLPGNGRWTAPLLNAYRVTDGFHPPSHYGVDLGAAEGTPIVARGSGTVYSADACPGCPNGDGAKMGTSDPTTNFGFGCNVVVRYAFADLPKATQDAMSAAGCASGYLFSRTAHMEAPLLVKAAQAVVAGTVLGRLGTSGNSTGNHTHLEHRIGMSANPQNVFDQKVLDPTLTFVL